MWGKNESAGVSRWVGEHYYLYTFLCDGVFERVGRNIGEVGGVVVPPNNENGE